MQSNSALPAGGLVEPSGLGSVVLPADSPILRNPPRPPAQRQPGYDAAFDHHTLFFDCFLLPSGTEILCVGPPLLNLRRFVEDGTVTVVDLALGEDVMVLGRGLKERCRSCELRITLSRAIETGNCRFDFGALGVFDVVAGANQTGLFKGKRVVMTLFKYEPLSWLVDWATFNVRYHGANAFLVNHNDCPHASTTEIYDALAAVPGIEVLVVGALPFPYGPGPWGDSSWDSTFCQVGSFAQARFKYLSEAAGVLNTDIDELVVTEGHRSLFDMLKEIRSGMMGIGGKWIYAGPGQDAGGTPEDRRHRDFTYIDLGPDGETHNKWIVDPQACGPDTHWRTHGVRDKGLWAYPKLRKKAMLCHFRDINTRRKCDYSASMEQPHEFVLLREAFERVGWR